VRISYLVNYGGSDDDQPARMPLSQARCGCVLQGNAVIALRTILPPQVAVDCGENRRTSRVPVVDGCRDNTACLRTVYLSCQGRRAIYYREIFDLDRAFRPTTIYAGQPGMECGTPFSRFAIGYIRSVQAGHLLGRTANGQSSAPSSNG
jgi:hypothetical protein